jgi:DNA-binding SARP family transcriptional activator
MEFRILGPLEVDEDGRRVELGGARQRALLAILLTRANQVVSRDRLIDELFGEEPRESAGALLQVYVSRLRKALEPGRERRQQTGVVVTKAPGYLVRVGPDELDLARFERLAEEGRSALAGSAPEIARERLVEALALWRGPALADFALEPFAQGEARRLEELRLAAVEDRIDAELELGRHDALVGELESLIGANPLRERLRGQLMLALYRSGRQAEALDAYQATRRVLVDELGIEPNSRLQELERAILRQDPSLEPGGPEAAAPAPGRSILVVGDDERRLEGVIDLVEPLVAGETARELVAVALVPGAAELNDAVARLHACRDRLRTSGVAVRVAAFTSTSPAEDVLRLASERGVELALVAAGITADALRSDWLTDVVASAPCDVGLVSVPAGKASRPPADGPVLVPFGGAEHDWAALELGAWLAAARSLRLVLVAPIGDPEAGVRDASRLLGRASLLVQRVVGVPAEPLLTAPGPDAVLSAAAGAALLVVGLSSRWREEGLGATRSRIAAEAAPPVVFAARGLRPGGLAPESTLTRFSWSLREEPGS